MKKLLLATCVSIFTLQCKKESTSDEKTLLVDSVSYTSDDNQQKISPDSYMVTEDKVKGAWFEAEVPAGFEVQPSVVSPTTLTKYDSYFYISPDRSVKFYIYSPQNQGVPNDIVFPNEKIKAETVNKQDGTVERFWTLPPNRQTPYYRSFTEKKSENKVIITGFYYMNDAALQKYQTQYDQFRKSVIEFTD